MLLLANDFERRKKIAVEFERRSVERAFPIVVLSGSINMRFAICVAMIGLASLGSAFARDNSPDPLAVVGLDRTPPVADVKPVTEVLWGVKVTDPYRYMEALDPTTRAWMKEQGDYTRAVFDAIKPRAALEQRIAQFTGSFGITKGYASYGDRSFYQARVPGSDNFDLMETDASGTHKLVNVAALRAAQGGKPLAINFFLASPDGAKVAVGISSGGSEDASITVIDADTKTQIAGPIDRAEYGATAWSDDGTTLYIVRLKALAPDAAETEKYKDSTLVSWNLHDEPVPILGSTVNQGPKFSPIEVPILEISPGGTMAAAVNENGVQYELAIWLIPVARIRDPQPAWKPFVMRSDDVTSIHMRGDEIFLLSHKNAPTFKVLTVKAGQPLSAAKTLLPMQKDRVINSIRAASDGLYVIARQGAYSQLLRIRTGQTRAEEIALPFKGYIGNAFSDPRVPGLSLSLESWVRAPSEFRYDPATRTFTDLALNVMPALDPAQFTVQDLRAEAHDGVLVPLSVVQPRGVSGPQITYVYAYGSYGESRLAAFNPRTVGFLKEGGTYATCHVRGGGELGEAWRLGGKDANKPNTWRDLIACSEDMIARGITTKDKLFIQGGSAGGIAVGRAFTERPDLFAGAIDLVPAANKLREEFSANGPPNIPEFGTVSSKKGFENLYEMDTLQHVKMGTHYPAVLITAGLNDPRLAPWQPAKLAALLQASGTANPVLLRIDPDAGHGNGSTKTQNDQENADIYSFIFWRAGLPDWGPRVTKP
jgi:prolyl oligopeptidase